jgi:DNA-binding response OmpR family regulator
MPADPNPVNWRPERPPKDFFHFLVVDDEPVARNLLRSILNAQGYDTVDEVASGEAALIALSRQEYHLILLDKNMPGTDGLEVLRQGRELRPGAEFIMITAYGSMESAIQAMDLGAFSYLTKPLSDFQVINVRVEAALDRVWTRLENALLVDRLRMVVSELTQAENDLEQERRGKTLTGSSQILRIREAIERLKKLSALMERFRARIDGPTATVIQNLGAETDRVAELLKQEDPPLAPGKGSA